MLTIPAVILLYHFTILLLPYHPADACCGGCCCGGCGCGCCNYGNYQPQVPAIIPIPVETNNNNNNGAARPLRYDRYTNSFSYDGNNGNSNPYGSARQQPQQVYGMSPPYSTNQLSALVAQLQRQAAAEAKKITTTTTTTTRKPTTTTTTTVPTTTTTRGVTVPEAPPAWFMAFFNNLRGPEPTTSSSSTTTTTTATTTTLPATTSMSPLVAQLSDEQLRAVLQALVDQHASLFQKPTTTPPPPTTTTVTPPTTPQPAAALSEEQQEQLHAIMQSLGLRSRGAPEELADLIAQDAAAAGAENDDGEIPFVAHAVPRLLSLLGDDVNGTDPTLSDASTTSSPMDSSTPKPLIPVNIPVPPAEKDELTIRENMFAWENGALTTDEMGAWRPEFDLAELGGYEKLNPASVDADSETDLDDQQLQNVLMDFYYKFDTYDARWGGGGVDTEDGPETVLRWRGQDADAREGEESARNGEGGKEAEKGGESAENEENGGYLHRLWKKFF